MSQTANPDAGLIPEITQQAAEQALLYSDKVIMMYNIDPHEVGVPDGVFKLQSNYDMNTTSFRRHAWHSAMTQGLVSDREFHYVIMLEGTQLFREPELVRDAIEFNSPKVIYGTRYYMWDDERTYRSDSYYVPVKVPIAAPFVESPTWRSNMDTYPLAAYTAPLNGQAAYPHIELLDYRYANQENRMFDGTPHIESFA